MKVRTFDVAVIGGGAAGMMAAVKAAEAGATVVVVEKKPLCGRKIMITGKGRCNLTNTKPWAEFSTHLHPKASFAKAAFFNFSNKATIEYFNGIGMPTVLTQGQRIYPESMNAASVVDALVGRMSELGVELLSSCELIKVEKRDAHYFCMYNRISPNLMKIEALSATSVIVATGGLSYPLTGSTGKGYDIARNFGHEIKECFPSLTALTPKYFDTRLIGLELENVGIYLTVNNDIVQMDTGDLSFTNGGIEGSLGFRVSRKAVHAMINGNKVEVVIDLKPALSVDAINARIAREAGDVKRILTPKQMSQFLRKFMPEQMVAPFMDSNKNLTLDNLAEKLKEWRFPIVKYVGYERAVVTAGGVSTDEIVSKTMQSRLSKGLFFAGEVIDVDGDTGGYNLQFAFSSGALAGENAAKYSKLTKES